MITNTKFYQEQTDELVSGLVFGLAFGLVFGLAVGLIAGLASGLVAGLASGLIAGLIAGLAFGLASGLVAGLASGLAVILVNWTQAFPLLTQFKEIALVILGIVILIELFYWLDSEKPKKATIEFVLKKKFEATCEVLLGLSAIAQIYILGKEGIKYIAPEVLKEILKWSGYIGVGMVSVVVVVGIVYFWLQLNKLKFRK